MIEDGEQQLKDLLEKINEKQLEELLRLKREQNKVEEKHEDDGGQVGRHVIRRRGGGHSKNKKNNKDVKPKGKKPSSGKGSACRQIPMDIRKNRPNLFDPKNIENIGLSQQEREELEIACQTDKRARETKKSFKKPIRPKSLMEVECCSCHKTYEVATSMVYNANRWKCNDCSCQPG